MLTRTAGPWVALLSAILLVGLPTSLLWSHPRESEPLLVVLAGQSNMQGRTTPTLLRRSQRSLPPTVRFFAWNRESDISSQTWVGPEVAIATALADRFPGRSIWLVKAAVSGTSISAWDPTWSADGVAFQDNRRFGDLYRALGRSLEVLQGARCVDLAGVVWMQGERDARSRESAEDYPLALATLVDSLRLTAGDEAFPIVLGMISPRADGYPYTERIREAQQRLPELRRGVHLVDTAPMSKLEDGVHLDWAGSRSLGTAAAEAIVRGLEGEERRDGAPSAARCLREDWTGSGTR